MKKEIERIFLVNNLDFKEKATSSHHILQGYLNKDPERTVRIRIKDQQGWLTIKGRSNDNGTTRLEWEIPIALEEAHELLQLAKDKPIEKNRYIIPHGKLTFEVDEFLHPNRHLILAEIELPSENTPFQKPQWLGREVTGNPSYFNAKM